MLPLAELFVHVYVLVDDAIQHGHLPIPTRPGPTPACSDSEVLTLAVVRVLARRPSERAWLAEVNSDWAEWFPHLPAQSEYNRRVRWLWGAFELLRTHLAAQLPVDAWQQLDTSALPVKHPSRVRGPDHWTGPGGLRASFGRDGAHGEWFYGFRLGLRTDLGSRLVRGWGIVAAAVDERQVADGLLEGTPPPVGLLLDRGFTGQAWAAEQAARGTRVVLAHSRRQRRALSRAARRPVAALRNRVETTIGELTELLGLARHGAHLLGAADPHRDHRAGPHHHPPRPRPGLTHQPTSRASGLWRSPIRASQDGGDVDERDPAYDYDGGWEERIEPIRPQRADTRSSDGQGDPKRRSTVG